ncbi:MAG: hypothetical protein N2560_09905 [Ignavibacteria bacterium]|nr:hypothetical protein [Ignavibacteria bacterium]
MIYLLVFLLALILSKLMVKHFSSGVCVQLISMVLAVGFGVDCIWRLV